MIQIYTIISLVLLVTFVAGDITLTSIVGALEYTVPTESTAEIWRITVPSTPLAKVHFCFEKLNINSAELQIYDLAEYQQGRSPVFDCIGCGKDIPPMFSTKSGVIIIFIKGIVGVNFISSSFRFTYIAEPASYLKLGSSFNAITLKYNMGYAKFFPITAEGKMPPLSRTSWVVNVNAPKITFSFDRYPQPASTSCGAVLTIYDGTTTSAPTIFNGSIANGLPPRWRYSSSGKVLAVLQNGPSASICPFEVSYYADMHLFHCGSLFAPDILKSKSMVITDGSVSTANMKRGDSCSWRMLSGEQTPIYDTYYTPTSTTTAAPTSVADVADLDSRLTLLFPWVHLKAGGQVVVYDGDNSGVGSVLWDSKGSDRVVPPPLHSTGRSLYVAYSTNTQLSTGYAGFRGEYLTRSLGSLGIGTQNEVFAMSSALDITPPGYRCYGESGSSTYSGLNCVYTTGLNYTYLIKPQSITPNGVVSIMFSSLQLTHPGDSLTVYDGTNTMAPVLATWTGSSSGGGGSGSSHPFPYHWINSTGTAAFVRFISQKGDSSGSGYRFGGFSFSYYSDGPNYHCGFSTNPAQLHAPSQIISDGSSAAGVVLPTQSCTWSIAPRESPGGVLLVFHRMSLGDGGSLTVYTQDTTAGTLKKYVTISDTSAVPAPISTKERIYIAYTTGSNPTGLGFLASYMTAQGKYTAMGGAGGKILLFCTSMTRLQLPPTSLSLASTRHAADWTAVWEIRPTTVTSALFISINSLTLPPDCSDYLALYANYSDHTSALVWTSCGLASTANNTTTSSSIPHALETPTNWVSLNTTMATLQFVASDKSTGNSSFDISYTTDGSNFHCGFAQNPALLTAPSFVITDGSGSKESMYKNQHCEWVVQPKAANVSNINNYEFQDDTKVVVFLNIYFSDLFGARLQIYDGNSAENGVLLWDCDSCTHVPPQMASEYGVFFIKYTSTDTDTVLMGKGFRLYYYSLAIPATNWSSSVRDTTTSTCTRGKSSTLSTATACVKTTSVVLEQPYDVDFYADTINSVTELDISGRMWMLNYPQRVALAPTYDKNGKVLPPTYTRPVGVLSFWPSSEYKHSEYINSNTNTDINTDSNIDNNIDSNIDNNRFLRYIRSGRVGNGLTLSSPLFNAAARESSSGSSSGKQRYYCGTWHTETPTVDLSKMTGYYDTSKYARAPVNGTTPPHSPILVDKRSHFEYRPSQTGGTAGMYVATPNIWRMGQEASSMDADQLYKYNIDTSSNTVPFTIHSPTAAVDSDIPYASSTCRYAINTAPGVHVSSVDNGAGSGGFPVTFRVILSSCTALSSKRLRIYGGIYGNDTVLYDSLLVSDQQSSPIATTVVAPCGRAIILLDNMNSEYYGPGEVNTSDTCGFDIDYSIDYEDTKSATCDSYIKSIFYVAPEAVNYWDYLIPIISVVGALLVLCCCVLYVPMLILKAQGGTGVRRNIKTTSLHPRFTPKLDEFRNKFLYRGTCCVCKDGPYSVFRLACNHQLCKEDLRGYIENALGDVSMFPLKCPMHYEGCSGTIGSDVAKRVVNAAQYSRFIDFLDRALFGDGIRCIFCENFVIYPSNSKISMVTCPYCVQLFCMRCRQPWHFGAQKCPLEKAEDESLEVWKAASGAQRCPACRKLIEKDDPDTCHHMVHRTSDGIPCVRDRTDFCYLCGVEVAAEYPHDEVNNNNTAVNHFPDGVFQKCRTIIAKEKAAERELLRKSKRLKKSPTKKPGYSSNFVLPTEWDNDTASTPSVAHSNDVELVGGPAIRGANMLYDDASLASSLEQGNSRSRFESDFDAPWEEAVRTHPASPVPTVRRGQRGTPGVTPINRPRPRR